MRATHRSKVARPVPPGAEGHFWRKRRMCASRVKRTEKMLTPCSHVLLVLHCAAFAVAFSISTCEKLELRNWASSRFNFPGNLDH